MIISGLRSLPLSVHNRFVITFTNTLFFTSIDLVFIARTNNGATHLSLIVVVRGPSLKLLPWIDIAPLPCLGCFCTVLLCCLITWSHPQPSLSGIGVLWVSTGTHQCVDPPRQGGGSTMAPTLWLLLCCCIALSCIHVCACDHIEHAATNKK